MKCCRAERRPATGLLLLTAMLLPAPAAAHSFGRMYNLPVPFWMYAYGATAALLLSFLVVGVLARAPRPVEALPRRALPPMLVDAARRLQLPLLLRGAGLLALGLCLISGYLGTRDPYRNFNMTFFWVVFVLGFAWFTAIIGNGYRWLNPWRSLAALADRLLPGFGRGRRPYPARWAYAPALLLYMAFIWIELFGYSRPRSLADLLAGYTLLTLFGVWLYGARAWFRHGEFFAVFLRLLATMAPLHRAAGAGPALRAPFAGLLEERIRHWTLLLFVLFMLSSTAFDGLRATVAWYQLFWGDATGLLTGLLGEPPLQAYVRLRPWYLAWESVALLVSPLLYLAVYLLFIALARQLAGSRHSLRALALAFAPSLLPIALVYHITHYYTLILTQGVKIVSLVSDPLGRGWNLFGTAQLFRAPFLPDLGTVWHTQVGLILFGHVVSVWIAHLEALRLFPSRRQALLSQLPMLLLMMAFTTAGLWILAQPIQGR